MTIDLAAPISSAVPAKVRGRRGAKVLAALRRHSLPVIGAGVLIIGTLEFLHRVELFHPLITPSPFTVGDEMRSQASTDYLWSNMWITVQESLAAFLVGSAIGFLAGVAIGMSTLAYRAGYPYLVLVQSMPRIALAPVFIAVWGFGMGAKIATAVAIVFFPVLINTMVGIREADDDGILLLRSMGASRFTIFRRLMLPGALPAIMGGLKTGLTLAFIGAIVGELQTGNAGIGLLITSASLQLRMAAVYGVILWLALVTVALFMVLEFIDRKVIFWKEDHHN